MADKFNKAEALSDSDLNEVTGGIRMSRRVTAVGETTLANEDPLSANRLICTFCGNPMTKSSGCTNPACINNTNIARA